LSDLLKPAVRGWDDHDDERQGERNLPFALPISTASVHMPLLLLCATNRPVKDPSTASWTDFLSLEASIRRGKNPISSQILVG
jgi:hypothetical protein